MTLPSRRSASSAGLTASVALFLFASPCFGFYESQEEETYLSLRASIRALAVMTENPDAPQLFKSKNDTVAGGMARLEFSGAWGGWLSVDFNSYALGAYNSAGSQESSFVKLQSADRSGAPEIGLFESIDSKGEMALDWANLTVTYGEADLTIGRQPVNLASTLYFTPNDFFAPFAADVFYRVYKAGVDAVRLEAGLGALTQLTLLTVAGYGHDQDNISGYKTSLDRERTSYLCRISAVAFDYELVVLGGKVRRMMVYGGSFQGTFFDWLGVRAEGHLAKRMDNNKEAKLEWTLELERRFPSSLDLRLAVYHHGAGVEYVDEYTKYLLSEGLESPYMARWYAGAGATYEFSPLWTGTALALMNLVDGSSIISLNAVYSLSDEGEMFIGLSIPAGDAPYGFILKSEMGARPRAASVEARYYF